MVWHNDDIWKYIVAGSETLFLHLNSSVIG